MCAHWKVTHVAPLFVAAEFSNFMIVKKFVNIIIKPASPSGSVVSGTAKGKIGYLFD